MIEYKNARKRGVTRTDWLESYHSFSFNRHYDPDEVNFGSLRVLNDDIVKPGGGFPEHPHNDMEIITIILEGKLAHEDSTGTKHSIGVGEVQRMTAGSGIRHSEYNNSDTEPVRLLQIWFYPEEKGLEPSYEDRKYNLEDCSRHPVKIASPDKDDGSATINQDAYVYLYTPKDHVTHSFNLREGRGLYIYVYEGCISMNGYSLRNGDSLKVTEESSFSLTATEPSGLVIFDVKMDFKH